MCIRDRSLIGPHAKTAVRRSDWLYRLIKLIKMTKLSRKKSGSLQSTLPGVVGHVELGQLTYPPTARRNVVL